MEVEKIFSTYWLLSKNNGSGSGEKRLHTQWLSFYKKHEVVPDVVPVFLGFLCI